MLLLARFLAVAAAPQQRPSSISQEQPPPPVSQALTYALSLVGTKYGWWKGGKIPLGPPAWSANGRPPKASVVKNASAFCAAIPNLMRREVGLPVPCEEPNDQFCGGTGAYGVYFASVARTFNIHFAYPRGTLLGRPYKSVADQGHVAVVLEPGLNGNILQSYSTCTIEPCPIVLPGVVSNWTLGEAYAQLPFCDFEYAVLPADWLLGKPASTPVSNALALSSLPGPYEVKHAVYSVPAFDSSDRSLSVTYPVPRTPGEKFPLISYAHGAAGGGWYTFAGYFSLWEQMASYGLIIAATKSCTYGCKDKTNGSTGWNTFYLEQLKTITFARNETKKGDPVLSTVDWRDSVGVGICGHSMGGQATVRSAAASYVAQYNIRAAALHHPEVDSGGAAISVPLAAFTGDTDHICPAKETHTIYDPAPPPKTLRNQVGANVRCCVRVHVVALILPPSRPTHRPPPHHPPPRAPPPTSSLQHLEPVLIPPIEDPKLAIYTAHFFRAILLNDTTSYAMVYGNASDSLCASAKMVECGSVL